MKNQLLTIPEILEIALDIFEEMAIDNLEQNDLNAFNKRFDNEGAVIAIEVANDWSTHISDDINLDTSIEVNIGFADEENDVFTDILARLLISRDPNEKFCHIKWKRK